MTYSKFAWQRAIQLLFNPTNLFLTLSILLSVSLLSLRIVLTNEKMYLFLVWNLFLAMIPLVASTSLRFIHEFRRFNWILVLPILGWWLIFLPNAPYILTDLFHLRYKHSAPMWLDTLMIVSFAWTGLVLGFISMRDIQIVLEQRLSKFWSWVTILFAIGASSFGIYLGRYLRWNSWDLWSNPEMLLGDVASLVFNAHENLGMVAMIGSFSAFLLIAYLTITQVGRADSLAKIGG